MIPTTLVGMVDASTAGKTCLNSYNVKNILGTFYYPKQVYNNVNFLTSHSGFYNRQGISEVYKYGLLGSKKLLILLNKYIQDPSNENCKKVIELCTKVRIRIRKKHPQASNLGHTFGHAIEQMTKYKVLHGDAISVGTVISLHYSLHKKLISKRIVDDITKDMIRSGLNLFIEKSFDAGEWVRLMMSDKKSTSTHLNLVLLRDIEFPYQTKDSWFFKAEPQDVKKFLSRFISEYPYRINNSPAFIGKDKITYNDY
jgi:3-dehydroquinate synthetase